MRKRTSPTILEQAIIAVPEFEQVIKKLSEQVTLRGQSKSTLDNYTRRIALCVIHFGKLPEQVGEDEINEYLCALARDPKSPSRSSFKHMVYGLRYYYRLLGMNKKAIALPSLKGDTKLPVILNHAELKELFAAPQLLKQRIVLALIYSAGLRGQEVINLKLSDVDFERMTIHIRQSKYKKDRIVPLSPTMAIGLRKYLGAENPHIWLFNGKQPGSQYSMRGLSWVMRENLKKTSITKKVNLHTLRHTYLYNKLLFRAVWGTLFSFGYSHFGVLTGAVAVLHTWGQNLSLHPHIHCLVPAAGAGLRGQWKNIGTGGNYLYPVHQLSAVFKGRFIDSLERKLRKVGCYNGFSSHINKAKSTKWVVNCQPSMAKPEHVIRYLGQYTHRVAISNNRILDIGKEKVTFIAKDYRDGAQKKPVTLDGVEFLRRFLLHILPKGFVKIRRFGIYHPTTIKSQGLQFVPEEKPDIEQLLNPPENETPAERTKRLTGFDPLQCPTCKKGKMVVIDVFPRVRSPAGHLPSLLLSKLI